MRWRAYVAVVLGILLVFAPQFVGFLHIGDPTYRYEATEIEPTDDGFELHGVYPGGKLDDDIACVGYVERACPLERQLLTESNVSTRYGVERNSPDYEYVVFDEGFYRITYEKRDSRTYLGLEAVSSEEVFRRAGTSVEHQPQPVQQAVESGSATVRRESLEVDRYGNELVNDSGTYYLVSDHVARYSTKAERRGELIETASSFLGPMVGLVLVLWGWPRLD